MDPRAWQTPRLWAGKPCAIIGGGPSLTQGQVDSLQGRIRTIAINNAYTLAPWTDILYFCDRRWFEWHKDKKAYQDFAGIKVTLENYDLEDEDPGLRCVHNMGRDGLHLAPGGVMTGRNSGIQAINLAVHLGVSGILLLGFDMHQAPGKTHFHNDHQIAPPPGVYVDQMLPCFETIKEPLLNAGVVAVNCTPGSVLNTFPHVELLDALPR